MSDKKKYLLFLGLIIVIDLILWFSLSFHSSYYNKVELSGNNLIVNKTEYSYMDTVVSVGLDKMNIKEVSVTITHLTDDIKEKFEGDEPISLNAAIVGNENQFIIYVSNMDREHCIVPLSHEIIHLNQFNKGKLQVILPDKIMWDGIVLTTETIKTIPYGQRSWEEEAFKFENHLGKLIEDELYEAD